MIKNPPANAGDTGSIPGPGRSHMPQSNEARAPQLLKPASLEPVLCNKRSPRSPQAEKARTQQQRPNADKNKNK